jgi:hypoxanthine phosphoribosyltransferase
MEKIYLSWGEIETAVENLACQIKNSDKKIGSINGLARGGLIPAVILSHKLGIPFMNEDNDSEGYVLIVDDICDTGETLKFYSNYEYILTATIHHKQTAMIEPDFYYDLVPEDEWIVYPWEQKDSKTIQDYKDATERE